MLVCYSIIKMLDLFYCNFKYIKMRRIIFLITVLLLLSKLSYSQNFNWITPNKNYLKLSVADDGMYRISRTDFTNAGISTASIDPRTVKVYNKGSEIPIYFLGEGDGVFDANDYFDFYGTRNYGGLTKYYTVDNALYYTKDEYFNNYSDTNVYWVGWDGNNGIRFTDFNYSDPTLYGSAFVNEKVHFEKDKLITQGERSDGNDYRNFNNELFQGEGWYWANMYNNFFISDTISTPLLNPVTHLCSLKIFAYPSDINLSSTPDHLLYVTVNNTPISSIYRNDFNRFDTTITFSSSLLSSSSVNTIKCTYYANAYDGHVNFDFMKLQYGKIFKFRNNQFAADLNTDTTSKQFRIKGYVPGNLLNIFDIKNNYRITNYTNSSDTLIFTAKSNAKLEILNKAITKKPFKIITRQVPDLVSVTNGADYLLIYNSLLSSQAEQLRSFRESHDGFRSVKADVRDIYDIFNYGIEDPVALRNFGKYVYNNWQLPKFKYLCLFGRGSLDPKKNASGTIYQNNLIPVVGNPTSDAYFANFNFGAFSYGHQVAVGRITAYTAAEAQIMVDNIISYETQDFATWWKNTAFIVGGATSYEQSFFQSLINPFINNYIVPPSVSGNAHKIFRTDYTTTVTYNYMDSVRRDINNGVLIANFQGHAGNSDWEDAMNDPTTLDNYGKLPFVLSFTCYTGKNSEPTFRSFGERYMNIANRGAIGFIGSTGWGWAYSGNTLQNWMLYGFARDTLRRIGDIAKFGNNKILYDSSNSTVRHSINCYGMIGDPALKLAFPKTPEFHITNADYKLSNDFPALNETVYLTVYPKNIGLFADSVKIRFNLKKNNIVASSKDTTLKNFKYSDSVLFSFKMDSLQNYKVEAILDYDNRFPTENIDNNIFNLNIPLKNISFLTIKPYNNAVLKTDSVEFVGLNPYATVSPGTVKVLLEMDTSLTFNSPVKKSFFVNNASGVVTKFKTSIPVLNSAVLNYWRTNAVINNDSSGWTKPQSFSYDPAALSISEKTGLKGQNQLPDSNNIILSKFNSSQFSQYDLYKTSFSGNGILLNTKTLNLSVRSMGSSGAEISNFKVNDKGVNIDGGRTPGLSMLKVKKLNGQIIELKTFQLTTSLSSDSVLNFLNTFDSTFYLMALNASYVDQNQATPLNTATKNKIKSFGSTKIDSIVKFGWFDTWSFIGSLGATPANVSEQFYLYSQSIGWRESNSSLSRTYKETYGTVSNIIGPAQGWKDFSWTQTLIPQSTVLFDVIGIDKNNVQTLLLSNQNNNSYVDLSSINAYQYPYLNLLSKISIDTINGYQSSVLNALKVNFLAPAELLSDKTTMKLSDTICSIGSEFKFGFNFHNPGYISLPGVIVNVYKVSPISSNLIKTDTVTQFLDRDSMLNYYNKFTVPFYRAGSENKLPVYIELIPKGHNNDIYTFNNPVNFNITLKDFVSNSNVIVYSDGAVVKSGDFLSSKPEMKIVIQRDELNGKNVSDTSQIFLRLNDTYVPYYMSGKVNSKLKLTYAQTGDGNSNNGLTLLYYPELNKGQNKLTLIYKNGTDDSDTAYFDFSVSGEIEVSELYNFPNPMKEETNFVFNLKGGSSPVKSKIKIYTAAGRLIKEIDFTSNTGYNQILWDGKDSDGDIMANGTYLYKFVLDSEFKVETQVQKLVILR